MMYSDIQLTRFLLSGFIHFPFHSRIWITIVPRLRYYLLFLRSEYLFVSRVSRPKESFVIHTQAALE